MSRSFKKNNISREKPYITLDHNKRFRRINKIRVRLNKEPLDDKIITSDDSVIYEWYISKELKDKRK